MRAVDSVQQEPLSATDAVAFVAALLASQFMLFASWKKVAQQG